MCQYNTPDHDTFCSLAKYSRRIRTDIASAVSKSFVIVHRRKRHRCFGRQFLTIVEKILLDLAERDRFRLSHPVIARFRLWLKIYGAVAVGGLLSSLRMPAAWLDRVRGQTE